MLEKYSKRFGAGVNKKAASHAMSVFFLCLISANAQTVNSSNGSVYGDSNTVLRAESIQSFTSGRNDLDVFYADTHTINLKHSVEGYINISNRFDRFTLIGKNDAELTAVLTPALSIFGGTNLTVSGGAYLGGETNTLEFGNGAGIGGFISGVQTAEIFQATFSGGTIAKADENTAYPPLPGGGYVPAATGSTGLYITNSTIRLIDDASINGGNGGSARSFSENVYADGGNGVVLLNASATITNTTIQGGTGGTAVASRNHTISVKGGHAVYASGSNLSISNSDLRGGNAGSGTQTGVPLENPRGGNALTAVAGSSITASNTTFSGADGSYAAALQDSDLTAMDSSFLSAGLFSSTTDGKTNTLFLSGGTYTSLTFNNATNGIQHLATTNISLSAKLSQNGGTVHINNLDSDGLSRISINSGKMIFSNDLVQASGGTYTLNGITSSMALKSFLANGTVNVGLGRLSASEAMVFNEGSALTLNIISNNAGIVAADRLTFETNSSFKVDASMAGFSQGTNAFTVIATTNGMAVGDNSTPTYQDFTNGVNTEIITTVSTNYEGRTRLTGVDLDTDLTLNFYTMGLAEYWGNPEGTISNLANELDEVAPQPMLIAIDSLGAAASLNAVGETYFSGFNSFQTSLLGLRAAVARTTSRGTEFRDTLGLPKGAKGPDSPKNDWRFWGKYYGQFYSRSGEAGQAGYDSSIHGGVFGVDKSFGQLLLGAAGGMGRYQSEYENDFEENISAVQALVYTTWGQEHVFVDAGLACGFNNVESETAEPFVLEGDFNNQLISGYIGGGYGFEAEKMRLVFTPEAGVQYTIYQQDAYTETSSMAVPRSFDDFDADSLQTTLGLNMSMIDRKKSGSFSFKAEGRLHWLHELNPEPGNIGFNLENGNGTEYTISYPMLDEDAVRIGIGLSFFNNMKNKPENMMFRLDFDELVGEKFNSHNIAAKAVIAF